MKDEPKRTTGWSDFTDEHLNRPPPYQNITCCGKDQFMDVVEELVRRGIGFKANFDAMSINLTGGH